MSEEYIECHHPAGQVTATFSRRAFEEVWKDLGWVEGTLPEVEGGSGDPVEPIDEEAAVEDDLFDDE
jgi:hypothetical protein